MRRKWFSRRLLAGALAILLLLALIGYFHTPNLLTHAQRSNVAPRVTMLAIGDSLTVGYYASTQHADYISLLTKWMNITLLPNVALYGTNAPATLNKLQQTPPPKAAMYLLELGTNDKENPVVFTIDYQRIIAILHAANPIARFVCLGPWGPYNTQHDTIGKAIKANCPGPFVDLQIPYYANHFAFHGPVGRKTWLGAGDWFHPNDQGHLYIARAVYTALGGGHIFQKRNKATS